jgi:putative hydrolase of the HAD superfamily
VSLWAWRIRWFGTQSSRNRRDVPSLNFSNPCLCVYARCSRTVLSRYAALVERSQTIVLDLGEVLVSSAGVLRALAAALEVSEADLTGVYWPGRGEYDRGGPARDYWASVLDGLGRGADPELALRAERLDSLKWSQLPDASAAFLARLGDAGRRPSVLSNAPAPLARAVRDAPWSNRVEQLVFSADLGLCKPEPEIYARADAVYGTAPDQVVFFDDRADNVAAARAHGWDAHIWPGPAAALELLGFR